MNKNSIFIHTAIIEGYNERISQFIDIINVSGLSDNIDNIYICYIGEGDIKIDVKYEKFKYIKLIKVSENVSDYELPTLQYIYNFCIENVDYNVLYIHTKNIGKQLNICIEDQIKYMLYFLVSRWKDCVNLLNSTNNNSCGVDLRIEPSLHYSGNFWWAKSNYIKRLPPPIQFSNLNAYPNKLNSLRHNQEFWICYLKQNHYSLWDCGISVYERHLHEYKETEYMLK